MGNTTTYSTIPTVIDPLNFEQLFENNENNLEEIPKILKNVYKNIDARMKMHTFDNGVPMLIWCLIKYNTNPIKEYIILFELLLENGANTNQYITYNPIVNGVKFSLPVIHTIRFVNDSVLQEKLVRLLIKYGLGVINNNSLVYYCWDSYRIKDLYKILYNWETWNNKIADLLYEKCYIGNNITIKCHSTILAGLSASSYFDDILINCRIVDCDDCDEYYLLIITTIIDYFNTTSNTTKTKSIYKFMENNKHIISSEKFKALTKEQKEFFDKIEKEASIISY